ncbi:glycosyltransferase family 4 protein [Paeniglutamicibacter sp. ZC-3]|uniref:glycosyltransferase family 4 protein n=1 Tax=Paeniglutamicibacter sp. ZC-3 TaxID=2986919 RepID=UPI0021F7F0C6|nr:glycosyltransferase family 4 protein [Paeniglutamicibacter sp. ZC-3]MCV9994113.1 glycosyltransferase family 4 protein [Paeniglutamicibacter sp. ZC-3]
MVSRRLSSAAGFLKLSSAFQDLLKSKPFPKTKGRLRALSALHLLQGRPQQSLSLIESDDSSRGHVARARILAFLGEYDQALREALSAGHLGNRLVKSYKSEIEVLTGSYNHLKSAGAKKVSRRTALHLVTNSLPFTNSGYTQRTHSVLSSMQDEGWGIVAYSRIGYPWNVGQLPVEDVSRVDAIEYRRLLPKRLPSETSKRIELQTSMLRDAVRLHRPAVLHTTTEFVNGLSVGIVAAENSLPWVYEVRGQLADTWQSACAERSSDSFKYRYFKKAEAEVAKAASAVITLGDAMKQELVKAGVDPSKILVCPNAVGEEYISDLPDKSVCRVDLGLNNNYLYIGTVSSLVGYEGLDLLVRAFADLTRDFETLRLLIVGDGTERATLVELSNDLGVGDRVIFTGRVDKSKARKYHRSLDIFVVPRRDLAVTRAVTPLKPVEALASEVPVIVSDLPALREIVTDGVDGFCFQPESQPDLVAKLRLLLDDASLRKRLGSAGRKKVLTTRTWAGNAAKISDLYDSLADQSNG